MTHEFYYGKYFQSQKKVRIIQALYPNADKVQVNYWLKHFLTTNDQITKFTPENYEASIFHHLKTIDTSQLDLKNSTSINYNIQKSISVMVFSNDDTICRINLPSI